MRKKLEVWFLVQMIWSVKDVLCTSELVWLSLGIRPFYLSNIMITILEEINTKFIHNLSIAFKIYQLHSWTIQLLHAHTISFFLLPWYILKSCLCVAIYLSSTYLMYSISFKRHGKLWNDFIWNDLLFYMGILKCLLCCDKHSIKLVWLPLFHIKKWLTRSKDSLRKF